MGQIHWKQQWRPPLIERFGTVLQKELKNSVSEPLPQHWSRLVDKLNAKEADRENQRRSR